MGIDMNTRVCSLPDGLPGHGWELGGVPAEVHIGGDGLGVFGLWYNMPRAARAQDDLQLALGWAEMGLISL